MDYRLEALGDDRFQKLCQSILTATYPNVQCLPVNQSDGGRDAYVRHDGGSIVFQVKFSNTPTLRSERDAVQALIASEKSKVEALIKRGATSYILMTNISGTPHPDVGSIDKTNEALTTAFGIPAMCWWRDDIERRIEVIDGLIWRYPEIIKATDFLEILESRKAHANDGQALDAFRSYMNAQYIRDSEVKFQQVQIQNSLLDLFTDTPIALARDKQPTPTVNSCSTEKFEALPRLNDQNRPSYMISPTTVVRAADWLLSAAPAKGLQRIVLEGAPGQGKSTVTQYICQVNRIKSLQDDQAAEKIPIAHLDNMVRLPIRIDLRDYSTWLAGFDPFAGSKAVPRPAQSIDTLEYFIAHQIRYLSGGRHFDVEMFNSLLRNIHCLIVLDGFDEVADIATRSKIIDQTRLFGARMQNNVASAQLIVTSRPNAFILSSGFPEREWMHLSLRPLHIAQISEYADKWIVAKELGNIKGAEFKDLLGDRVSRPHIRSLAQNPMQLAILLNLINTKGLSLPDKRTALYESYMDLFFGREAEKDEVVRENRDVLMQIHEYVAWLLQTDAERPGGAGSMTQAALEEVVRSFIEKKGHDIDVLSLFQGAVERVGALVSRVQGMLEFEVQPLREYFAGRFLYMSAPYSTMLEQHGGSRPRRFAALAKRPYWSNVARFYAGCYNSGELASLLVGLQEVHDDPRESLRGHALQLGLLLLSDWVFSQEPRIVSSVVAFLTAPSNFQMILANPVTWQENRILLPARCGRAEMGRASVGEVIRSNDVSYMLRAGSVATANSPLSERLTAWQGYDDYNTASLLKAIALGIFADADRAQLDALISRFGVNGISATINAGRWRDLSPGEMAIMLERAANRLLPSHPQLMHDFAKEELVLRRALWLLSPGNLAIVKYDYGPDFTLNDVLMRYGFPAVYDEDIESSSAAHLGLSDFVAACERSMTSESVAWVTTLTPWSDIIESARRTWGETLTISTLAACAAGIQSKSVRAVEYDDLLDDNLPLAERARHARLKNSMSWWLDQWRGITRDDQRTRVALIALSWAAGPVLQALLDHITVYVEAMSLDDFQQFARAVETVAIVSPGRRPKLTGIDATFIAALPSARMSFLLSSRLSDAARKKAISAIAIRHLEPDEALVRSIAGWMVESSYGDPVMWEETVQFFSSNADVLSKVTSASDVVVNPNFYRGRSGMTRKVAESIIRSSDDKPMVLLEAAVLALHHSSPIVRRPIGEIAQAESWFT